ncbi:M3 family oligoendopeptidase [Nannocystis punicea]|uniref:M3 family oligoendopeptidase n=1 Tax=Nannocystis punicea TaxID=2995304 RepID=A0ABY7GWZ6_9BACT|nr:M3 family oligoendopeptidase [Nannocystis poenicansa]WAS91514.1 M3 family oligoendopeptidase [Nannocystis poenicansa]
MTTPVESFVPPSLDAARWDDLEPLYKVLRERPLGSAAELERLLLDRSELDAAVSEAEAELYIASTRAVDDASVQAAYLEFVETVEPKRRMAAFELDRRIVASPFAAGLERGRYGVLLRDLAAEVELFRAENVPLAAELARLDQEYNQIGGAMTVEFRGEERTLAHLGGLLEEPDRATREAAWRTIHERRYQDRERLDAIFEQMLALRHRTAIQAGFRDFRDYQHRRLRRFDYTPEDCLRFHDGIAEMVVPLLRRSHQARARALDVAPLRPWDLAVDVKARPPLRPFDSVDQLVARTSRVFHRLGADLGRMFDALREGDCLDLASRKGKAPGGYQYQRQRTRRPFIFMNATGVHRDVVAMVHEAGHAFHAALCKHEPLLHYRTAPMEFAEVASMSMELLTLPFLDEFYGPEEAARARRNHLEDLLARLAWTAQIDAFQHWLYTHPEHTKAERGQEWVRLGGRFGAAVSWEGVEHLLPVEWHRQLHLFSAPFYYIEYGIAQLGALQLWSQARRSLPEALSNYTRALAVGGSMPVPELYREAGLRFDLGVDMIRGLLGEVERTLAALPD